MEVGDYVRTKYGIAKYISDKVTKYGMYYVVDRDIMICNVEGWENCVSGSNEIIKSSPNIMDLIEEGDILKVNDFKDVYTIYEVEMFRNPYTNEKYLGIRNDLGSKPKRLYEIPLVNLSIVTHEQFESMQYKVGE